MNNVLIEAQRVVGNNLVFMRGTKIAIPNELFRLCFGFELWCLPTLTWKLIFYTS